MLVTPSRILSSAVVLVTPSRMFNSVAVLVTPSRILSSDVVAVTPSRRLSSVAVAETTTSSLILGEVKVLLVRVSVVALPTSVSVAAGNVRVTLPL